MALAQLEFPYNRLSGRIGTNSTVNTWNGGQQLLRQFTPPANPETTDQQAVRIAFSLLTKNWKLLTPTQREGWSSWAAANPAINRLGTTVKRTGLSAYVELGSIHYFRTGTLLSAPPTLARPAQVVATIDTQALPLDSVKIIVDHSIGTIANLWVMARATPIIPSPAITPPIQDYRMIRGVNADSFQALAVTGTTYTFTPTRYTYDEGVRFAIEVQIVNIEGYASIPSRDIGQWDI